MWVVVFSSGRESLGNWLNGGELLCESSRERRDTEGNLFKVGRDILCGTKAGRRGVRSSERYFVEMEGKLLCNSVNKMQGS